MAQKECDYKIIVDEANRLIRVSCSRLLDVPLAQRMITQARHQAAGASFALLYDFRRATLSVTIGELFDFPKSLDVYRDPATKYIPVAVLVPPKRDSGFWQFYEDAAVKAGHIFRIFHSEAEAIGWLHEKSETPPPRDPVSIR